MTFIEWNEEITSDEIRISTESKNWYETHSFDSKKAVELFRLNVMVLNDSHPCIVL